jgi:hypothetical protein
MGQEIDTSRFKQKDFLQFQARLQQETELLRDWFEQDRFSNGDKFGGFELEVWLTDDQGRPKPDNARYLEISAAKDLPVVAELARFNIELNSEPRRLHGAALSQMFSELTRTWHECNVAANEMDASLMMIGILPSADESQFSLANMSDLTRYRALNEQVLRLRAGRPLTLDIRGREKLHLSHNDVMFESAATSFQLHLQLEPDVAARYYNAAHILAAPMVAIGANSPYLFGRDLWDETRIPLFEQAVALEEDYNATCGKVGRVTFGVNYVRESIHECFQRNLECYPILLPAVSEDPDELLPHLRLHNGTIWRWNRPLIGFDEHGNPHLRLEHRVLPSGPTVVDTIANAALFFGAVESLANYATPPEHQLDFERARANFYAAAKNGLRARPVWLNGRRVTMPRLLEDEILPLAEKGLNRLGIDKSDISLYLGIITGRLKKRRNGAEWQRSYVARHGRDMTRLTLAYRELQQRGQPVHEWPI